jgi:heat shock protein HtpX
MKRIFRSVATKPADRAPVGAVLGHEIAHGANGDMVTRTLLQGVLNTCVIFLARIVGNIVERAPFKHERDESEIGFFRMAASQSQEIR